MVNRFPLLARQSFDSLAVYKVRELNLLFLAGDFDLEAVLLTVNFLGNRVHFHWPVDPDGPRIYRIANARFSGLDRRIPIDVSALRIAHEVGDGDIESLRDVLLNNLLGLL